jgi:hypothetical protein
MSPIQVGQTGAPPASTRAVCALAADLCGASAQPYECLGMEVTMASCLSSASLSK